MALTRNESYVSLDVGAARVGVALASAAARIAAPYATYANDEKLFARLQELIARELILVIVVGLPRGLDGQETEQTKAVRAFAASLQEALQLPVVFQDEALTSLAAEAELQARHKPYTKADIDALAATIILSDYLRDIAGHSG
jgi:putative Holliday junction resolvase